jgi:single-strand DNA-binding protein
MAGVNMVCLLGNVGRDPEVRNTQNGTKVANLSIATSESWIDKASGERKEQTEWHRVVVWDKLADVVERFVRKGSKVYVQGKLQTRKWTDANGNERFSTEVVLQGFGAQLQLCDGRANGDRPADDGGGAERSRSAGGGQGSNTGSRFEKARQPSDAGWDDDIPF